MTVSDTWRCHGARDVPGRDGERGYIQIPKRGDDDYEVNARTIYSGIEGRWFHSTESWGRSCARICRRP